MPTKTLMSIEEFERLPDDGMRHELTGGELITTPPPKYRHSAAVSRLFRELGNACASAGAYEAYAEAGFRLAADTVRQPDLAIVSLEKCEQTDPDGYIAGSPEVAIEVASPSNSVEQFEEKISQYLEHGTLEVWVVYPKTRHVHIFEAGTSSARVLSNSDLLTLSLLPGWSMPVRTIFQ
jgi:Uma2 family endonuclease